MQDPISLMNNNSEFYIKYAFLYHNITLAFLLHKFHSL